LADGTKIPRGSNVTVLTDNMLSPTIYSDPQKFDPYRYLNMRKNPGEENKWQFVTTSPEHIGFGHGMHACPGRFFASNEVKVALVFLLLRFEWKVDESYAIEENGEEKQAAVKYIGTEMIVDPDMKILFKRRQPEIDIMSCLHGPL
jgi:cytochrome P450